MAGIKVVTTKVKSKAITSFPCIGVMQEGNDRELIVLFETNCRGTVLQSTSYEIGHISTSWKIDIFTPYTSTVKLTNK